MTNSKKGYVYCIMSGCFLLLRTISRGMNDEMGLVA